MAEKDERKKKKRRSPMIAGSLVALAAAVVLLFRQCGIELPFDFGGLGGGGAAVVQSDAAGTGGTGTETAPAAATVVPVSVVGNDYFFNNERCTLDELTAKIKQKAADSECPVVVEITDDAASKTAYEALTGLLNKEGIQYKEIVKGK